jgi:hypothetical protein
MSRRIEGLVSQYPARFNGKSPEVLQNGPDRPSLPDRWLK